jgi:hypothetical protein
MRYVLLSVAFIPARLLSQAAVLLGSVEGDTARQPLGGAEVSLPLIGRTTTANYLGHFRIDRLPAGKYLVVVRRIGFMPLRDTVELVNGSVTERAFTLRVRPVSLDSVVVSADGEMHRSPALRAFERRRAEGFGHFVTEDEFRKDDQRAVGDFIITKVPGTYLAAGPAGAAFLATTRNPTGGRPAFDQRRARRTSPFDPPVGLCYVTIYVDGIRTYSMSMPGATPPDFHRLRAREFAAAEFYAGGATLPPGFNATGSDCGTLLLWTRER